MFLGARRRTFVGATVRRTILGRLLTVTVVATCRLDICRVGALSVDRATLSRRLR